MQESLTHIALVAAAGAFVFSLSSGAAGAERAGDPYLAYLAAAPEFQRSGVDSAMRGARWDTWLYMPWRYKWDIGTGDEGGKFCRDYGINGGFTDHGEGPLEWLEKWNLRFYNDHTAGKGYLHLRGAKHADNFLHVQRVARAGRAGIEGPQPVNYALLEHLKDIMAERIGNLKNSPLRVAYALDDETSWGIFVVPIAWRINGDDDAYARWLETYHPGARPQYVTPDFVLPQHDLSIAEIDLSPLLDRVTYNDSVWALFLGSLVDHANALDPETPCGIVGAQSPSMWGGYDYAKLSRKVQYFEAYDLGSSQAVIRSFNPGNAMPVVTSHFHPDSESAASDKWQAWYYFAHGNRGIIGWIENWFDGSTPRPWLADFAPALREIGGVQGPKLSGARWLHDGVAIYYSHPSIQVSWCLDIEPHGKTWPNRRYSDFRLGTSHTVRKAWENILTDYGVQYNFIAYNKVALHGVPEEYRVLILPACYALSDAEAARIREFAERGGTVIADFATGLFDQHGKGRAGGVLDDFFGVTHSGRETRKDFFGGALWVEADQDAAHDFRNYRELVDTVKSKLKDGYAVAEPRLATHAVRKVGRGTAVYLNLSPLRYLAVREEGKAGNEAREPFVRHLAAAGVAPWVRVASQGARPRYTEVTCWENRGRTYLFVVQSATMGGTEFGGGQGRGLLEERMKVDVEFAAPVKGVVNERTGEALGDGAKFTCDYDTVEAVMLSFERERP